jgi:Rrf2 family protein
MKTSTKARYSLRLMVDIAQNEAAGPVSLKEASRRQGISTKYLEQLAKSLGDAGYVASVRGAQGGYRLTSPAEQISAGQVIRAAEGEFLPVVCLSEEDIECPLQEDCTSSRFWGGLRNVIDEYVNGISIADLAGMFST